jgi:hypothetical protein
MFGRIVKIIAGKEGEKAREWSDLQIEFSVKRTENKRPSPAKINIYNLSSDSRSFLERDDVKIQVVAGYRNQFSSIFFGDIDDTELKINGLDRVLEIKARDGGKAYSTGFVSKTFEAPTDINFIFNFLASEMGLRIGYFDPQVTDSIQETISIFSTSREAFDDISRQFNLEWSIQNNEIFVLKRGNVPDSKVILISPGSGMVGSPERSKKSVKVRTILNGLFEPKKKIALESEMVSGPFRISEVEHKGSVFGSEFFSDLILKDI